MFPNPLDPTPLISKAVYDFSVLGGSGDVVLLDRDGLEWSPVENTCINKVIFCFTTPFGWSGETSPTIKLTLETDGDIISTALISNLEGKTFFEDRYTILLTATRNLTMTIAENSLTSGKLELYFCCCILG